MKIRALSCIIYILIFIQNGEIYSQNLFGVFSGGRISIKGESSATGHSNDIDLISYQLELEKNNRRMENKLCMITKYTDAASTALMEAMQISDLKNLVIENYQSSKVGQKSLGITLTFEKVQIINIRQWYDETKQRTIEEVKISYNKLRMSYAPKKQEVEITLGEVK